MSRRSNPDGASPGDSKLSAQDWLRLRELFLLATESPPANRKDFLDRHCGEDHEMRAELESLLETDDHGTRHWLKEPLVANDAFRTSESGFEAADDWIPERVGPYILRERLGGGGMGSVWLAELDAPFPRQVAIKFPQTDFQDEEGIARFLQEMQILASLDHPGITRVLDAGRTTRGGPWFAMDRIDGQDIESYCDGARLSVEQRLDLFTSVCDAVHHAHQRGIVHLDIKPANVLVEESAGVPRCRLIDFGIARLNRGREFEGEPGRASGTLAYMSPEQAAGDGAQIDIRSDVYSLGILLRTLLAGSQSCLHLASEQVLEGPPELCKVRSCTRAALAKRLVGDLDWIMNKACLADPSERYDSVSSLATDVRRHLADEPLQGFRTLLSQRIGKSLRKRRAVWLALGIAFLGILAGGLGLFRAWSSTARLHREEVLLHHKAQVEADRANHSNLFLAGTLALADPRVTLSPDLTALALLDNTSGRIQEAFQGDPLGEATIRQTIGDAYRSLGEFDDAALHLRETVRLLQEGGEWHSLAMYDALWSLVFIHDETSFRHSLAYGRRALEVRDLVLREMSPALADTTTELLDLALDPDVGIEGCVERLLELADALPPEHAAGKRLTAESLADLGFLMGTFDSDSRAQHLLDTAASLLEEGLPPMHPDRTRLAGWTVQLLLDKQEWDAAAHRMESLIKSYENVLAENHWRRHEAVSRYAFARAMAALEDPNSGNAMEMSDDVQLMLASIEALESLRDKDSHSCLEARARLIHFLSVAEGPGSQALRDQRELLLEVLRDSNHFAFSWRVLRAALLPLGTEDEALEDELLDFDPGPGLGSVDVPERFFDLCEKVKSLGEIESPKDWLVAEFVLNVLFDESSSDPRRATEALDWALRLWGGPEQAPILLGADLYAARAAYHRALEEWDLAISDGRLALELYQRGGIGESHSALECRAALAQSMFHAGNRGDSLAMLKATHERAKQLFGAEGVVARGIASELKELADKKK